MACGLHVDVQLCMTQRCMTQRARVPGGGQVLHLSRPRAASSSGIGLRTCMAYVPPYIATAVELLFNLLQ